MAGARFLRASSKKNLHGDAGEPFHLGWPVETGSHGGCMHGPLLLSVGTGVPGKQYCPGHSLHCTWGDTEQKKVGVIKTAVVCLLTDLQEAVGRKRSRGGEAQ